MEKLKREAKRYRFFRILRSLGVHACPKEETVEVIGLEIYRHKCFGTWAVDIVLLNYCVSFGVELVEVSP